MILKSKHGDTWRLIDNITQADILPVKVGQYFEDATIAVRYQVGKEFLTQAFADEVYLLNDNGKTIQRLDRLII